MFSEITSITIHATGGDVTETDPVKAAALFGQLDPLTMDGRATDWLKMADGSYTAYVLTGGCLCSVEVVGTPVPVPGEPPCITCEDMCEYN